MKDRQKKIIIVFNSLDIGGIETKILDICNYYSQKKDYQLTLILKLKTGPLLKFLPKNIQIKYFSNSKINRSKNILFLFWLVKQFRQTKPDLIITFGNFSSISSIIGKQLSLVKANLVISEDSSINQQIEMESFSFLRRILIKLTYPLAQKIIVLSPASQDKLIKLLPSIKNKIIIKENWLPFHFTESLNQKNIKKDIDILFLARLENQKNPIRFLEIIKEITKFKKNLKIYLVGSGSLEIKIKDYIIKNNLKDKVRIKPFTLVPQKYYLRSKILLISSDHEGFPLTVLEALATKCIPVYYEIDEIDNFFKKYRQFLNYKSINMGSKKILFLLSNPQRINEINSFYLDKVLKDQKNNFNQTINEFQKYC